MFYYTRNHVLNWKELFDLFSSLKLVRKCFSDTEHVGKYLWAAISFWNNFEIISGNFPRAEMKLFQSDVDKVWNNFEIILFYM